MNGRLSSRTRHWLIALGAIAAVAALAAASLGVAVATDRSAFCTSCHEMQPYHQAWAEGPHSNVPCVDCHVERGLVAHLEHKFVALAEVKAHFLGEPTFPVADAPEVPDDRCTGCHSSVTVQRPGFSHTQHAAKGPCQSCHSGAGHDVSAQALGEAGVLNPVTLRARAAARTAAVGKGRANLQGHVPTDCQSCHDMKATPCKSCHSPKHASRKQDCGTCHAPGPKFVFWHPASPKCVECHAIPAKHTDDACVGCHPQPGVTWAFNHDPAAGGTACEKCHARPDGHRAGTCSTCHASGASWAFSHPSSESCAECHKAPARHYGADCSRCHTPTVPFPRATLQHPGANATCSGCHKRPANHRSGECITCHPRVGDNWAFAHPSSNTCTACHKTPTGHSTSGCTTCHPQVGKSWAFAHPASAACTSCHKPPAGHYAASCTTCHGVGSSWAFSHPGPSASCTTCHATPAGHAGGACTTCHRVSANWAFYHPAGTNCAACHGAPANHYGSSCASCHSVSQPWASATFQHPAIPGGKHTYRSFQCASCHPNGYSSATCIKCHDTATGPKDDD